MVNTTRSTRYGGGGGIPPGIGLREENVHPGSGLRVQTVTGTIVQTAANYVSQIFSPPVNVFLNLPAGEFARAEAKEWVSLIHAGQGWAASQRLSLPMTPSIRAVLLNNTFPVSPNTHMRYRVSGWDQFGNRIVEVTPWIHDTTWALNAYVYMVTLSKVFSYVDGFEFMTDSVDGQLNLNTSFVTLGFHAAPDPSRSEAAAIDFGAGNTNVRYFDTEANWGIGTPLRVSPYNTNQPYRYAEIIGGSAILLRERATPAIINTPTAFPVYGSLAKATGILTFAGNAAAAETVTIGSRVYTFRAAINSSSPVNEVLVGATAVDSIQNLRAAINGAEGAGTAYSGGTVPHAQVECHLVTATTVQIRSRFSGYEGNTIATTETMGAGSWGTPTLTEGAPTAGMVLGRSLTGWEGCAHKIGFRSSDNWATQKLGIELGGSSVNPAAIANWLRDEIEFSFTVRSALGTTRDSVAV